MSKHKNLKRNLLICLLAGSAVMYPLPLHAATSVIANNTLPSGGQFVHGEGNIASSGLEMNITQNGQNAVIKWNDFSVGGNATVNFDYTGKDNFNTLNYVNSGKVSQIYGTINAQHEGYNGNIFIVNTAGVQIGPSAQINVGSLHVSSNTLDDNALKNFYDNAHEDKFALGGTGNADAALMSLGNINANKVTFEGDGRIVIDSERIKDVDGDALNTNFKIHTNDADNVIIGYEAYNAGSKKGTYEGKQKTFASNVYVNGTLDTNVKGYMWVEDVEQLQAINTNLTGNYALRNSIDATSTEATGKEFSSLGIDPNGNIDNGGKGFTGKFDGIDYNIFGLNINETNNNNVGLFGYTDGATINNVTLVGGSITGGNNVGAVVGNANNTILNNVVNSAAVNGNSNVGGIVGTAENSTIKDAINTGSISGSGDNIGGLIGNLQDSKFIEVTDKSKKIEKGLIGNSYNLGNVSGAGHNVGGLVGYAVNSTIGDGTNLVYNRLDVTGAYNVGGIVGNMEGTTVQNAENSGTVTATGYTNGEYTYHTAEEDKKELPNDAELDSGIASVVVNVANVGGIAGTSSKGSSIENVTNSGDVSSNKKTDNDYYDAGNVGGIVGSAVDTNIKNATNRENEVRGAHNVGGVAGYFGNSNDADSEPDYTITTGINDGGDIMATGARYNSDFVKEKIRLGTRGSEATIIGNMGGIVGYLDGDNVYVTGSGNRGTVHSLDITGDTVSQASQVSNTGGIVGKIDRDKTKTLADLQKEDSQIKAAVSDSYNTGDIRGYMGVGGVVGMMYNGEVASSYNTGTINTTRRAQDANNPELYPSVNMGGVVGDTTEETDAYAIIYDVYNKGQIGDETYNYYARHVGGVVGRLSGTVEKSYNMGAIYNGYNVVGGIAGWFFKGKISNSFNTGNITVINNDTTISSQVGGIAGGVGMYSQEGDSLIENVYNLGTLRSFQGDTSQKHNALGGIVGYIHGNGSGKLIVRNVYTTGNLYAQEDGKSTVVGVGSIYGQNDAKNRLTIENAYYIKPQDELGFTVLSKDNNQANKTIEFEKKDKIEEYQYKDDNDTLYSLTFTTQSGGDVVGNTDNNWRIYNGSTPILNAFLPNAEDYFSGKTGAENPMNGIESIQYGTAYDPLLTIINAANGTNELKYDWEKLGINNAAGIAVYGAGLTLNDFKAYGATGYFGGIIYADNSLKLDGGKNDVGLGSTSQIYGSDVTIDTTGNITIYGDVTATGNNGKSDINISSENGDINVYGTLTSAAKDEQTDILGIKDSSLDKVNLGNISDEYDEVTNMGERYSHTTTAQGTGDITITANGTTDEDGNLVNGGNVNLYFGNQEQGLITTGGDLTVTGMGDVYVDSDLDIGGNMTLTSTGKDSEVLLTLTNIGKVQADRFTDIVEKALNGKDLKANRDDLIQAIVADVEAAYPGLKFGSVEAGYIVDALQNYAGDKNNKVQAFEKLNNEIAVEYMHDFMHSFDNNTSNKINLNAASGNAKLTVDMWDYDNHEFDFKKYDTKFYGTETEHNFVNELNNLNVYINNKKTDPSKTVYVEVSNGDQLKGIQEAAKGNSDILGYNFALKGDINASHIEDYVAIGTGSDTGFTGTFDGRGNRIIGLNVSATDSVNNNTNAGIFSTVGTDGVVKDVNIYSGNFTGTDKAGAVAGVNNGRIEGVKTFGNTVKSNGNAGGIVGVNTSGEFSKVDNTTGSTNGGKLTEGIYDVESTGSVIAGSNTAIAGGLVGTNDGALGNSFSDSAVTVQTGVSLDANAGLGGVVGVNNGDVQIVDSLGVTNGGDTNSSDIGGIIGINNGNMYSGYNESIVSGSDNVGGIIGTNSSTVENVVNATSVTSDAADSENVGGLVGVNKGAVTNGRNNGTITGINNVGGLVGNNASADSTLTNLVNDSSAEIVGENYVGGIAGSNAGIITAQNQDNLINRGSITGQNYVGGVAGENIGTIEYVKNDVSLNVKDPNKNASYFGGVAGVNGRVDNNLYDDQDDNIIGKITSATNEGNVIAANADYVGGIVGHNTVNGVLDGMGNSNEGTVIGGSYVGGVIGKNDAAIGSDSDDTVGITNEGKVIATQGGAGGLIGENNADITNVIMTNRGEVHGNNKNGDNGGTGGLIGVNSGNIKYSSLINEATGIVTGTNNVGGLIGKNTGTITGGRDAADSYYKYQIYNNGVINVGTYTDANNDGEYEFVAGTGSNIGGLIGSNEANGSLTAGYNTGAINAAGSENVGGIAGSNSGTIDQVFNTVMVNPSDTNQKAGINGGTNVGGLIGNNSGIISNAYNTTEVKGAAVSTGNLVGTNSGTVQYVYGVAEKLIGNGDDAVNGYVIDDSDKWLQEGTYEGFIFGKDGWKIYNGSTLPMLSVFLTKVTVVDQDKVNQYFSYKHYGQLQQITAEDIKALIDMGAIYAPDGFSAFENANGLISGVDGDLNAYDNWLYSGQIAGSNIGGVFNPNNLGYDVSLVYSPFEGDNDWPHNRWDYLFNDAPFDRNRDFRERKAEVNFVDGGMEI